MKSRFISSNKCIEDEQHQSRSETSTNKEIKQYFLKNH